MLCECCLAVTVIAALSGHGDGQGDGCPISTRRCSLQTSSNLNTSTTLSTVSTYLGTIVTETQVISMGLGSCWIVIGAEVSAATRTARAGRGGRKRKGGCPEEESGEKLCEWLS